MSRKQTKLFGSTFQYEIRRLPNILLQILEFELQNVKLCEDLYENCNSVWNNFGYNFFPIIKKKLMKKFYDLKKLNQSIFSYTGPLLDAVQ